MDVRPAGVSALRRRSDALARFVAAATACLAGQVPTGTTAQSLASPPPHVRYEGETLVVDGRRHAPDSDIEECGSATFWCRRSSFGGAWIKGSIAGEVVEGADADVKALVARHGLSIDERRSTGAPNGTIVIVVPPGFEQHWSTALAGSPGLAWVAPMYVQDADPRWAPATFGLPTAADVAYDGETLVVGDARYSRRAGLVYCRLRPNTVCGPRDVEGWALGRVVVGYQPESRRVVAARLRDSGLEIVSEQVGSHDFVVRVPAFFEEQWAGALQAEQGVRMARVDRQPSPGTRIVAIGDAVLHAPGGVGFDDRQRQHVLELLERARTADHCGEPGTLIVTGHADRDETADPVRLASARAAYVEDLLRRHTRKSALIWAEGKGASRPTSPPGGPQNRRTEIELIADLVPRDCEAARR